MSISPLIDNQDYSRHSNEGTRGAAQENIVEDRPSQSTTESSDGDVIIKFGHELTNSFLEADHLLSTNAWD